MDEFLEKQEIEVKTLKQSYLVNNILNRNYDPNKFSEYIRK